MKNTICSLVLVILCAGIPADSRAVEFDPDGFLWCGTYGLYPTEQNAFMTLCYTTEALDGWLDECLDDAETKSDRVIELEAKVAELEAELQKRVTGLQFARAKVKKLKKSRK